MELNPIVNCPFCGRLYRQYSHYCGDQSGCRDCLAQREREADEKETDAIVEQYHKELKERNER